MKEIKELTGAWDSARVLAIAAVAPVLVVDLEDAVVHAAVPVAVDGARVEGRLVLGDAHPCRPREGIAFYQRLKGFLGWTGVFHKMTYQ